MSGPLFEQRSERTAPGVVRHAGRRGAVQVELGAALLDPSGIHDKDAVGDCKRLRLIVGHEDGRLAGLLLERANAVLQLIAQVPIER